jgi:hypothetical protein
MLLLCIGKVTHHLFERIPFVLRGVSYIVPTAVTLYSFTLDAYSATLAILLLMAAMGLYHVLLALIFRDKDSIAVSRTYTVAWLFFFIFMHL